MERKNTHNTKTLRLHFQRFRDVCAKIRLKRGDLYNINETKFRIDCDKAHIVITMKSKKKLVLTDVENRDYIMSIECISAGIDEYALSSFLIVADA